MYPIQVLAFCSQLYLLIKIVAEIGEGNIKDWKKIVKIQNSALRFLRKGLLFLSQNLRLAILDNTLYKYDDIGIPISGTILKEEYLALGQNVGE